MDLLSTGQAAKRLSVTPDTILKWIKCEKIPAVKTVGGHYRISSQVVESLLNNGDIIKGQKKSNTSKQFIHCWEFFSKNGLVRDGCRKCLVFQARAANCYKMSGLPYESGFEGMFCETSCDECEYYHAQQSLSLNVMIITDKEELMDTVNQGESHRLNIRYTSCEYECSFLVDTFKPDVVIVDCAMPYQKAKDLCQHLYADPRIPRAKIILAMPVKKKNTKLFPGIHTQIKRPFSTKELEAHIEQLNIV